MYDEIKENIVKEYHENKNRQEELNEIIKKERKNTIFGRFNTALGISSVVYGGAIGLYILSSGALLGVWPLIMTGTVLTGIVGEKILYRKRNKKLGKTNSKEAMKKCLQHIVEREQLEEKNKILRKERGYLESEERIGNDQQISVSIDNPEKYVSELKINYDKLNELVKKNQLKANRYSLPIRIVFDIEGLVLGASLFPVLYAPLFENENKIPIITGVVLSSLATGCVFNSSCNEVNNAVSSLESDNEITGCINDTVDDAALCKIMCDKQKVLSKRR